MEASITARDQLDLQRLAHEAQVYQSKRRRDRQVMVITFIIIVFAFILLLTQDFLFNYVLFSFSKQYRLILLVGLYLVIVLLLSLLLCYFSVYTYRWWKSHTKRLSQARILLRQLTPDLPLNSSSRLQRFWKIALLVGVVFIIAISSFLATGDVLDAGQSFISIAIVIFSILAASIYFLYTVIPTLWIDRGPLQQKDYAATLRRIERLRPIWTRNFYHFLRGTVLIFAGRYQEAEAQLRECLKRSWGTSVRFQETTLNNLGYTLLAQERYQEARQYFEAAVQIRPESSNVYASLADSYLYPGVYPERALELVEYGILCSRNDREKFQGSMWATHAWALALLGRHSEADESLERALSGPHHTGTEFYFIAGQVKRSQGKTADAVQYFKQIQESDSAGMYRNLAERALREMSTGTSA